MAGLAYLLLPLTGLAAFLAGGSARLRFHGLQAIVFGTAWAALLYLASALSASATLAVGAAGALLWLVLGVGAALGADPALPGVGRFLWRVALPER